MHRILKVLFRLRLTQLLRRLGFGMPWIREEIEQEWFGGLHLHWDKNDVERAFNIATRIRGLEWVLGKRRDTTAFPELPGIGRRGGFSEFLRFGGIGFARSQPATGAPPFSTIQSNGFDSVDLANLNVHFRIPTVTETIPRAQTEPSDPFEKDFCFSYTLNSARVAFCTTFAGVSGS